MTTKQKIDWIKTFTGISIDPLDPLPEEICIEDIAHALSNQCRFAGHTDSFYSVAQHCVHVSEVLAERGLNVRIQFFGLLHDASEAYLTDMPTPIKRRMPEYKKAEDRLQDMIMRKFCPVDSPVRLEQIERVVKQADLTMLAMEARDLHGNPQDWKVLQGVVREIWTVEAWAPTVARRKFMERFNLLVGRVGE